MWVKRRKASGRPFLSQNMKFNFYPIAWHLEFEPFIRRMKRRGESPDMDVFSHWLWGVLATRKHVQLEGRRTDERSARSPRLRPVLRLLHERPRAIPTVDDTTVTSDFPAIAWDMYQYTHSAVMVTVAVLLSWFVRPLLWLPPRVPIRTATSLQAADDGLLAVAAVVLQHPARHPHPHAAVLPHAGVLPALRFRC